MGGLKAKRHNPPSILGIGTSGETVHNKFTFFDVASHTFSPLLPVFLDINTVFRCFALFLLLLLGVSEIFSKQITMSLPNDKLGYNKALFSIAGLHHLSGTSRLGIVVESLWCVE